jgi:hypothetical protein
MEPHMSTYPLRSLADDTDSLVTAQNWVMEPCQSSGGPDVRFGSGRIP